MLDVSAFDSLPAIEAAGLLRAACGSTRWVDAMVEGRPFGSVENLFAAADEVWSTTGPDDWREAFSHHPRIGERKSESAQSERAARWSSDEQSRAGIASDAVQGRLARVNREYEIRFGHIYLVCASGKSADELVSIAEGRLANDPETELRVAAEEQRKITRLRLQKLFSEKQ